jgi:hypothetical protein
MKKKLNEIEHYKIVLQWGYKIRQQTGAEKAYKNFLITFGLWSNQLVGLVSAL